MNLPQNKIPFKSDPSQEVPFTDPIYSKNRIISHAAFQLSDIAISKSWRLITFYRQINAILSTGRLNIVQKLLDILLTTRKYLGLNNEDEFNPWKLTPALSTKDQQIKLFSKTLLRNGRIAVILHLYYIDLWDEIKNYISHIPESFDLFISIPQGKDNIISTLLNDYPDAYIYVSPNCGRDVAPFVEIYSAFFDSGYSYICKIHTKKSIHLSDGDTWRLFLLDELLGSPQRITDILNAFDQYTEIGMMVPFGYLYSAIDVSTMTNRLNMQRLSDVLSISLRNFEFEYPAGSMFWCRAESFIKLAGSGIQTKDFPPEHGQLNNTLAHALERFLGLLVINNHQMIVDTSFLELFNKPD